MQQVNKLYQQKIKNITADEVLGTPEHTMKFRDFKAMLNKGDAKKFLFQYTSFRVGGQGIVLDKEVITLSLSNDDSLDSYFKTLFRPCDIHPLELKDEYMKTFVESLLFVGKTSCSGIIEPSKRSRASFKN